MSMTMTDETAAKAAKAVSVVQPRAHLAEDYARAEDEKLWGKVWQVACRVEEIPNVGDYVTYDILDESIIVVRTAADKISAYYNVCQHRGRRLTEGCGHANRFVCRFHGWSWDINGENAHVLWREDFGAALTDAHLKLRTVKADTWGGYVFINMDPNSESLADFLGDAARILNPYEIEKMRFRWRRWLYFPCNWKTALEAFMEGYHVSGTHPQLTQFGGAKKSWSKAVGKHGAFGVKAEGSFGGASAGAHGAADMRKALADNLNELWETLNASTTQTIVNVANRLEAELPEGTPADKAGMHLMMSAMKDDAARGVQWPKITPDQLREAGIGWNLFPNTMILQGPTFVLGYRARPNGFDPNSCIFEVYTLDRFPEGEAPRTENIYTPQEDAEAWRKVLGQDFSNMEAVQKGMKSRGYSGAKLNPEQEVVVENFHRTLAAYMGVNAPQTLK
jgi:phenylpropionate dioxygenase-like ring-hydroxylating dioxygenase large terminal subunit